MKRLLCTLLALVMCISITAFADNSTDFLVDNTVPKAEVDVKIKIISDTTMVNTETVVENQRTLIPIRALLESTGAQVEWVQETKEIKVTRDGKTITLQIGSNIMKTPDGEKEMDVAPILFEGTTTYTPLRAIAEEFGFKVEWDNGTKTILVTTPDGCPYVDYYEGLTLKDLVDAGEVDVEIFEAVAGLSYEDNKDKLYTLVHNSISIDNFAKMNGFPSASELKSLLGLGEDYPDDATWGEAQGDAPFGTYLCNVMGLCNAGASMDEAVAVVCATYGLGAEYTASTPFKFIRPIMETIDLEMYKTEQKAQEEKLSKDLAELPELLKNKKYFTITLADGSTMKGELYPDLAPETVKNFEKLVKNEFYDNLIFHRVIDGFMIQGGGYDRNFKEKDAEPIVGEFYANGITNALSHTKGVISMARTDDPNSASSQFFIVDEDSTFLDGQYAAFGKITSGLNILDKLSQVKTGTNELGMSDVPEKNIVIKSIRMGK